MCREQTAVTVRCEPTLINGSEIVGSNEHRPREFKRRQVAMEHDREGFGVERAVNHQIDGAEIVETVDISRPSTANVGVDEGLSSFFERIVCNQVLNQAIERLEERNIPEQIMDRRTRRLADVLVAHVTGTPLAHLMEDDSPIAATEEALIDQLFALTGGLRGAFAALEKAAADLGAKWEDDSRSFLDVTIAMSRLQLIMRKIVNRTHASRERNMFGNALVAVPSGEEHTFGQCMIEEMLRAQGWSTEMFNPGQAGDLVERVRTNNAHLVCFSWVSPHLHDAVATEFEAIETIPLHMRPVIIAGGSAARQKEKWMVTHGVDRICDNAYAALEVARQVTHAIEKNMQSDANGRMAALLDVRG